MIKEEKERKAQSSRGKTAEVAVRNYLTALNNRIAEFEWSRIYDARSAGGKFPSRPGDFEFFRKWQGRPIHGLIEVKEVAHAFRLPAKNFKKEQLAKLRKRQMVGGMIVILVYHSSTGKWRDLPLHFFLDRITLPSWDLSGEPQWDSLEDLMKFVHVLS